MKELKFILIVVCAIVFVGLGASMWTASADDAAARVPLENYLKGHQTGDGAYMRKAFHQNARIMGVRDGKLTSWTLDEYAGRMPGKPDAEEAKRKRRIESVEVTGDAGVAKLVFDYPQAVITDYMLLLKIDGEWKIVDKIYQGESKPKQQPTTE